MITPRPHQNQALEALKEVLGRSDRGQAHMCCGSGKTYVQAFLAQHALDDIANPHAQIVVCLVPNRGLIHQNARNFHTVLGDSVDSIGVCSDRDPDKDSDNAQEHDSTKHRLHTTTNIDDIVSFLSDTRKPRMVFSTYHSAPTLREAIVLARGTEHTVALGLFDEAHRTAGNKAEDDLFAFALDDNRFPIRKRAFFTATPRAVQGKDNTAFSMSNPDTYGAIATTYPFRQGIMDGNVVDYDLWVPVITRKDLVQFVNDEGLEGEERTALAIIALMKVMAKTGHTRFLAYHNRVSASEAFVTHIQPLLPDTTLVAHIDGKTPGPERDRLLQSLSSGQTLISNCKALVEGVDAPGVQGVLFVDPRKSIVDVVQAVGRLSRPDPNDPNKRGSIIAPILTESLDPAALTEAAKGSGFQTLVQVAAALRANDDALSEDILVKSRQMGREEPIAASLHNLHVLADSETETPDLALLEQAVTVLTMVDLVDGFAEKVGRLEKHIAQHGHLPTRHTDLALFSWMTNVRKKHIENRLEPEHAQLLDNVEGWTWIGEQANTLTIAKHIEAFRNRKGRMPSLRHREGPAETELHAPLMEAQEDFLKHNPKRWQRLTQTLQDRNLLFFTDEFLGKRAQVSGRVSQGQGGEVLFHPRCDAHRTTVPVFRSGHSTSPRTFTLITGRGERERLRALGPHHSLRVTLTRAGVNQDPFQDARILTWHAGHADHGETADTRVGDFLWTRSRLLDRKASGRPAYTLSNLHNKAFRLEDEALRLNQTAPKGTVKDVFDSLSRLRHSWLNNTMDENEETLLNRTPGFSWIDPSEAQNTPSHLKQVRDKILEKHAEAVKIALEHLELDTGLTNTLKMFFETSTMS